MKKTLLLVIILLLTISLTACKKGKSSLKTLTCDYSFTDDVASSNKTTLKIVFNQDRKTYSLVKGTVTFEVTFNSGLSNDQMAEIKQSLQEQFCDEGFFGEGTNKSCKVTTQTKSAKADIEVDVEKLVESDEDIEETEAMLDNLKALVEDSFGNEVKCTIN